jgi:hypothetical protein
MVKIPINLEPALKWIISILRKHNIPFQITGGLAAHIYGATRPINDIDIDVPDDKMDLLIPDIQKYITFGPAKYKDAKWDLKLITLNYNGQEIDIGGKSGEKILNDETKKWVHFSEKFKTTQRHTIFGIQIPVITPKDLIEYKKLLTGNHQKIDIEATEKYIATKAYDC